MKKILAATIAAVCFMSLAIPAPAPAQGKRDTSSFACGTVRCQTGQTCCPFGKVTCMSSSNGCDNDDAIAKKPEVPDYAPFSNTTVGYNCNPRSQEPCAVGLTCRVGKVGRSPMTMTSACQK